MIKNKRRLRPQLTYSCLSCRTSLFGAPPTKDNILVKTYIDILIDRFACLGIELSMDVFQRFLRSYLNCENTVIY